MRKIWIKKPAEPKGYSFWDSELSDDENCLREDDFKNSVCFVPEARFNELEAKLKVAVEALEEAYELIRSTGYTIDNNNGNRCMNGNEYVWIDRGILVMKEALEKIKAK